MKQLAAIALLLLLTGLCFAEATVTGHTYVTGNDATEPHRLANVTVTLVSPTVPPEGRVYRAVSNREGTYSITGVPIGVYTVVGTVGGLIQVRPTTITITRENMSSSHTADVYLIPGVRPVLPIRSQSSD